MATQQVTFQAECCTNLQADMVRDDYGVPGSHVWYSAENIDYADSTVDIAGVTVRLDELPKELQNALLELACEEIQEGKWE